MSSQVIEIRGEKYEENEAMLENETKQIIVNNGNREEHVCEDLEAFTSLTSLPGYIKGEYFSSKKGILNQLIVTAAVVLLTSCAGPPIGYSAIALPRLYGENGTMKVDLEMGSWIASVHSLATPVGSFACGPLMERFGRRSALQISLIPMIAGWIVIATSHSITAMLVGRVFCGLGTGLIGPASQVYLAEISEPRMRGFTCSVPLAAYSFGILLVYILGATLTWRTTAAVLIAQPIISLLAISLTPESPIWLVKKGKIDLATNSFNCLRGGNNIAHKEIRHQEAEMEKEKESNTETSCVATIKQRSILKPFMLSNICNIFVVCTGTFMIMFYAVDIIRDSAGSNIDSVLIANITAAVRLLVTITTCFLFHFVARRHIGLVSGIGSTISTLTLGIYLWCNKGQVKSETDFWVTITCLVIYIITNTGLFILGAVLVSELLPTKVRGKYGGYIFAFLNITVFVLTKLYPTIKSRLADYGMFILFGVMSLLVTLFIYLFLPETRNRSLTQIKMYFQGSNYLWMNRDRSNTVDFR